MHDLSNQDARSVTGGPWVGLQPTWADPPWRLSGRSVTAWFEMPWSRLEALLHPRLLMSYEPRVRVRLRFYEIAFSAIDTKRPAPLVLPDGRFREATFGVPGQLGAVTGEVPLFLWSDSMTYMMWGREVFGFPIVPGLIRLLGPLWTASAPASTRGDCLISDGFGHATIHDVQVEDEVAPSAVEPVWMNPRRILRDAGFGGEELDVVVVRPTITRVGRRFLGSGVLTLQFAGDHALGRMGPTPVAVEVVDDFELLVAEDVTTLSEQSTPVEAGN